MFEETDANMTHKSDKTNVLFGKTTRTLLFICRLFISIYWILQELFLIIQKTFLFSGELVPAVSAALQDPRADLGSARREHPGHRRRRPEQQAGRRQHD